MNQNLYKYAEDFIETMKDFDWSYYGVGEMEDKIDFQPRKRGYNLACGATRVAIIPYERSKYVLKFNFDYVDGDSAPTLDYNATEFAIYQRAQEAGVDALFASVERGGVVSGQPCVLQERVYKVGCGSSMEAWHKARKTLEAHSVSPASYEDLGIAEELAGAIVECYGEDVFYKFCRFCEDNKVNDIHNQNWGYIDGCPVVLDYAGYHENSYSETTDYTDYSTTSGNSWSSWGCSPSYSGRS